MQYVRALRESECKWFLYENNASISKEIQKKITKQLGVEPIEINSADFSAQDRKRLYWTNIPVDLNYEKSYSLYCSFCIFIDTKLAPFLYLIYITQKK